MKLLFPTTHSYTRDLAFLLAEHFGAILKKCYPEESITGKSKYLSLHIFHKGSYLQNLEETLSLLNNFGKI